MANYTIIDELNYSNKAFLLQIADHTLTFARIAFNGRSITFDSQGEVVKGKTYHIGIRILGGIVALIILPVTLSALAIKWWKREEWQKDHALKQNKMPVKEEDPGKILEIEQKDIVPKKEEEFIEYLQHEFSLVKDLDVKLPEPLPHSWREFGKQIEESNQTLDRYVTDRQSDKHADHTWPDHRPLYIQLIGVFSELDLKIIKMTCDYLHVFHHIPIHLQQTIMTMEQVKEQYLQTAKAMIEKQPQSQEELRRHEGKTIMHKYLCNRMKGSFPRENGQYGGDLAVRIIEETLKPEQNGNSQLIAFTSDDLFTPQLKNFVFGCASLTSGVGIWSKARFGDPSQSSQAFQACLFRMMKISAHEFGHMRGLPHCTDYECNIGGYMSLAELDSRPLIYCLQDMGKICYLTHTSLLQQHQKILDFFQKFNQTYETNCDFSKEIKTLKMRIEKLKGDSDIKMSKSPLKEAHVS
jgi:predicted Zn-dependent protease